MSSVELQNLQKRYGRALAVDGVDLHIPEGEFFSLLGPSGCGKSTTLRLIAGFAKSTDGTVKIGDEIVNHQPPERRGIGIVFQNYAIFPHMDVFENIAFGLRIRRVPQEEIVNRVGEALEQVGLSGYEKRFQKEMSGGEQQRVALARVLVTRPRILLLDEPLSALDRKLREEMKIWIKDLQKNLSITTIYVTHDQSEALTMSDRIAVMNRGKIEQVGTPVEIYEHPQNEFVASFIGESNLIDVEVIEVCNGIASVKRGSSVVSAAANPMAVGGKRAKLLVRPESMRLGVSGDVGDCAQTEMTVVDKVFQGSLLRYRLKWEGVELFCEIQNHAFESVFDAGAKVDVGWSPKRATLLFR